MAMKNDDHKETRYCPFKKAVSVEYNSMTGRKEMHERFEECAGERCMAYKPEAFASPADCKRLATATPQRR